MKFTINRKELLEALTITGRVINKNVVVALTGYHFQISNGNLMITGGNMECFIHAKVEIDGGADKSLLVEKDKFISLIKEIKDPQIHLEVQQVDKSIQLFISASSGKYTLPVSDGLDYPGFALNNEPITFQVESIDMKNGIDSVLFACADEDSRPVLTAMCLSIENGKAVYVGCNAGVLSVKQIGEIALDQTSEVLIPKTTGSILHDIPADENVEIKIYSNAAEFKMHDGLVLQTILNEGKYPDYKGVTPSNSNFNITLDKSQLINAIKRILIFSNEGRAIILDLTRDQLNIRIDSNEFGAGVEELKTVYSGPELKIGINGKFLLASLNKINSEEVHVHFTDHSKPVIIHDGTADMISKENYILIMPLILPEHK